MRLFRGLSEAIIGECLTVERVGDGKIRPWCPHLRTPFQSSAGRSTSGMGQGPFVMACGALEDVLRGAVWGDSFKVFFFHFPVSQCTNVSVCLCLQFSDRCRHICPTCVRKLGPLMMLLIRRKTVFKRLTEWNVKRCASNNEVVLLQIFNSPHCKLIMKKLKKIPTQR